MPMDELVRASLTRVPAFFRRDELAYLALTAKIEIPIRDRWAFILHQELSSPFVVSREWRRTDLAVLQNRAPLALIELKAMYTFDAALKPVGICGFCDAMERDAEKAKRLVEEQTQIYTLLLATHPCSLIDRTLDGVVKYSADINRSLRKYGNSESVASRAAGSVNQRLRSTRVLETGAMDGGQAFGVDVQVYYWLCHHG